MRRAALLLGALVFTNLVSRCAHASVLASSSLETCFRGSAGGTSAVSLSCSQKIVVTLSVPTGQNLETQSLHATLSQVQDGADTRKLEEPLEIAITKSPVYAAYPMTYLKNFNARPYELVVLTTDCKDGAYQSDATCGWFRDAAGGRVLDSQGFCCPCDAQSSWEQSVLGGATDRSRGNVNCNLFESNLFLNGLPASASCLRMSELWYAAYSIGDASMEFTLTITLTRGASNATAGGMAPPPPPAAPRAPEVLTLSPVTLVALNAAQTVGAELLGDLGGFQQMPVLTQKLLFIPRPGSNASDVMEPAHWPLLDTSAVSLDGSGCDKPGVMFSGFRNQPNSCGVPSGSCLANQLQDIVDADAAAMRAGNWPRSNVAALQVGSPELHDAQPGAMSPTKKRLALPATQLRNSIVVLTLNADSVRFVVNFSPGKIISAELVDFNGVTVGGYEALSGNGRLSATIVNNGTIDASYYLSVVNCSAGVTLIPSPGALAVPAGGVRTQQWACAVEDDLAARRNCTVVLQDARFVRIDTRLVLFYTNATQYDALPQLDGRAVGTGVGAPQGGSQSCSDLCPNLFNLMCAFMHGCWARVAQALVIIAVLLGFAWWTFVKCGPCKLASAVSARMNDRRASASKAHPAAPPQLELPPQRGGHRVAAAQQRDAEQGGAAPWSEAAQLEMELAAVDALLGWPEQGRGGRGGRTPQRGPGGVASTRAAALLAEYTRQMRAGSSVDAWARHAPREQRRW